MKTLRQFFHLSNLNKIRLRTVIYIALFWTAIDFVIVLLRQDRQVHAKTLWFREVLIFIVSMIMGYLFVFRLKKMLRHIPLWMNFLSKSIILLGAAFIITFILQICNSVFIQNMSLNEAYREIQAYALYRNWLLEKIIYWMVIFFITQLILIINEKYSPGVFADILVGRYIYPKIETRIVMFIDLKDSTPIAEKLGHSVYFEFIRDFIYRVSQAVIEFDGIIYQYVGDEVVCSWNFAPNNTRKCLDTVIQLRKNIQRKSTYFRNKYGIVPEFRIGIHLGEVTVGEIGVIKKDLAMSGDTMNTTARIRSACNELNYHFIVSKAFVENIDLEKWQTESLGIIELKGKESGLELFTLKI
ncbi:MAG: adenylate/guanylate cyclase domain-containing protein [Ginsengibacter sp.]